MHNFQTLFDTISTDKIKIIKHYEKLCVLLLQLK